MEEVVAAAKMANIHDFIEGLPEVSLTEPHTEVAKKFVLGCVIPLLAAGLISRKLGQTFLANSVPYWPKERGQRLCFYRRRSLDGQ